MDATLLAGRLWPDFIADSQTHLASTYFKQPRNTSAALQELVSLVPTFNDTSTASQDSADPPAGLDGFVMSCAVGGFLTAVYGAVVDLGYTRQVNHSAGVIWPQEVPYMPGLPCDCPVSSTNYTCGTRAQCNCCDGRMPDSTRYKYWDKLRGSISAASSASMRYVVGGGIAKVRVM